MQENTSELRRLRPFTSTPADGVSIGDFVSIRNHKSAPKFDFSVVRIDCGADADEHSHPEWEIVVVTRGVASLSLLGYSLSLKVGQSIRIPSNESHQLSNRYREPLELVSIWWCTET